MLACKQPPSQAGVRVARMLSPFTQVQPHESARLLWLFAAIFLILVAYYMVKPVREGWLAISAPVGLSKMEVKAYSSFLQSLLLLTLIPLYGHLVDRWSRGGLLTGVGLFFSALFPLFWCFKPGTLFSHPIFPGIFFYIWVGIFATMIIAQFWAFAADLHEEKAGQRLFPFIALGASLGALAGSWLTEWLVAFLGVDSYGLLLLAPWPLLAAVGIIRHVERSFASSSPHQGPSSSHEGRIKSTGTMRLIFSDRYLLLIALFIFLLNWVFSNGENILFAALQDALKALPVEMNQTMDHDRFLRQTTTIFYSQLYFWVNLMGMLLQAFVVSRLLVYGGVSALMLTPPIVSLMGYSAMISLGGMTALTWGKTAENATNYSLTNTARHVLWLPVRKKSLYKAKTAIDTLVVRLGDGLAALTVLVGSRFLDWNTNDFFRLNIFLILCWLLVAVAIVRVHHSLPGLKEKKS